ncbi:ABC transporter ATP-binding protein [Hazenella sp. IB182353]|uniref:ATP-binding cassette domain-containing protein n=1 Tax=Polycladospora coralii TaxID=2771432 RepID=UPI001746FD1D|nr:ABC transporter ATP-binding protein [Polycladospora coralii]
MTNPTTLLSVSNLTKKIGKREIVHNLNFNVQPGEVYGFLGPNGAGKTTTIRMLVGLIRPTAGTIQINGYDLQRQFIPAIRQIGCIVENPELYPYLTGMENMRLFARMMKNVSQTKIDEVIRLVELDQRVHDLVKTYSLGMKQRLGIAQALLGDPKLLILDEPTNGLDPAGIRELRTFIRMLATEKGISVFVSSHILNEVQLLCDRVAIIHHGRIVKTGPVSDLIDQHPQVEWTVDEWEQAQTYFKSLPYITTIQKRAHNILRVQMPLEKIAETNAKLLQEQLHVVGIRPYQQTLEDIFLAMTGGQTDDSANL